MSGKFSDELWDKFDVVVKKVRNGKNFTGIAAKFLQKRAQIESTYAKSLAKLCKDKAFSGEDLEMGTLKDCWLSIRDETESCANKHDTLADEINALYEQMQTYLNEQRKNRKLLVANGDKITKELRGAERTESSAKTNYEKSKKKQDEADDEVNKTNGTAKEAKAKKAAEQAGKKAEAADTEYREAVKQLQSSQQKFYVDEMPRVLDDLQKIEEDRVDKMREWLLGVVGLQESIPPAIASACENMRKSVESVDREADITAFISQNKTGASKPPEAKYEPYVSSVESPSLSRQSSRMSVVINPAKSPAASKSPSVIIQNGAGSPLSSVSSVAPPSPAQNRMLVRALYNYDATEGNELTFKANDRISVLQRDDSGWWQGEINGKVGMFPSNFVEPIDPNAPSAPTVAKEGSQCKVLYDYNADSDSELTIKEGERLTIESEDEGWFFGFNGKGESGRFPSNYVQLV